MLEVKTTTNGSWTLEQTEGTFQAFEASGAKFLRNELTVLGGIPKNEAYYEDLPAGQQPATRIRLLFSTATPLANSTKVWGGELYVNGSSKAVVAYRPD